MDGSKFSIVRRGASFSLNVTTNSTLQDSEISITVEPKELQLKQGKITRGVNSLSIELSTASNAAVGEYALKVNGTALKGALVVLFNP